MTDIAEKRTRNVVLLVLLPFIALGFCWLANDKLNTMTESVAPIPQMQQSMAVLAEKAVANERRADEYGRQLAELRRDVVSAEKRLIVLEADAIRVQWPRPKQRRAAPASP